jgi:cell division protein FtsB
MSQNKGVLDYISGAPSATTNNAGIKAGSQIASNNRPPSGLAPSTTVNRNRGGMTSLDRKDKVMDLEQENNILKEKKNLLEVEVKKMETKLRRIEALMRSRSGMSDQIDANQLQKDLQNEFDQLKAQNDFTREKVRKLAVIQRGLSSRPATAAKPNKYAHVEGKLGVTSGKVNH